VNPLPLPQSHLRTPIVRVDSDYRYETNGLVATRRTREPGDADSPKPGIAASTTDRCAYSQVMDLPWTKETVGEPFALPECPALVMAECWQCGYGPCGAVPTGDICDRASEAYATVLLPLPDTAIRSDILRWLLANGATHAAPIRLAFTEHRTAFRAFRSTLPGGLAIWMPMGRTR